MTERLYYTDSSLTTFDANVLSVAAIDGRPVVVLDRTAFYPASGGQPSDRGMLGTAPVVDVVDREDGSIAHVIDGEPPSGRVTGRVDWDRRFEHMQQHSGQHLLSAAFDRVLGARTVSFHLGTTSATIDLAREVSAAEIVQAEDAANHVVWEDRPVTIRFVDADEASALPLRKEATRIGPLRLVEVRDFDLSACGGTHVDRTGVIGVIAVSAAERFKGGTRLEFRCGGRALHAHRTLRDTVAAAMRSIPVAAGELPLGIERLQSENRDLRRRTKDLELRLALHEAEALASRAEVIGGVRIVIAAVDGADMAGLKLLAQRIAARDGHAALLLTTSSPLGVVIARSAATALDAAALLQTLVARCGGKGGGRAELAQGAGLTASPDQVLAVARALLTSAAA